MKLLKKSAAKTVSILLSFVMILSLFTVIPVPVQAAEVCTDILTVDDIGATGTNYVNWTARSGENHTSIGSAAVYSGNSAKGNGGIQLRSKSQSGVVTTVSGGIVRKITVAWVDTDRNNDRYLDVYGSNTAYSSAADLYSDARGTLLGTFFYNDASYNEADGVHYSEVEVSGEYSFFGFRSQKDALYLSSVTVDWEISDVNRVWNWAADYSSATCTFTDESESHTEDAAITSEVTKQPSYLAEGVLTHTATVIYNGVTYRDVQTEPIDKPEFGGSVPYIDENGGLTDSPAGAQLLTGNEGNLSDGWYIIYYYMYITLIFFFRAQDSLMMISSITSVYLPCSIRSFLRSIKDFNTSERSSFVRYKWYLGVFIQSLPSAIIIGQKQPILNFANRLPPYRTPNLLAEILRDFFCC